MLYFAFTQQATLNMQHKYPEPQSEIKPATLPRRFAAIFYDSLLCIALLFVITGIYMIASHLIIGAEEYRALNDKGDTINDPMLTLFMLGSLFWFFWFFWTKNGQTLGMQVWHLRAQTIDGYSISNKEAVLRFLGAFLSISLFGLGYFWMLIDKEKRSWQCIISNTRIVRIPKPKK